MRRIFLGLLFIPTIGLAHNPREGDIRALVGPFWYKTHAQGHDFNSPVQGGVGLLVEGDVNNKGGLEFSVFSLRQLFSIHKDGLVLTEYSKRIYIGMGYRYWFSQKYSAAVAFFSSYAMGDPSIKQNDFGLGNARPTTSAKDTTEYGFDFSLQWEPLSRDRYALVLDARYALSVTSKPGESGNFYGLLVGFKYFVQGQEPGPKTKN